MFDARLVFCFLPFMPSERVAISIPRCDSLRITSISVSPTRNKNLCLNCLLNATDPSTRYHPSESLPVDSGLVVGSLKHRCFGSCNMIMSVLESAKCGDEVAHTESASPGRTRWHREARVLVSWSVANPWASTLM